MGRYEVPVPQGEFVEGARLSAAPQTQCYPKGQGPENLAVYPKGTQSRGSAAGTHVTATEGSPFWDTLWML